MVNKKLSSEAAIATNKKARHDFTIEKQLIAGISLQGWEVKSLRAGHVQLQESYVQIKKGEAWLLGCHMTPLPTVSLHQKPNPTRIRKLLLTRRELTQLTISVERKGYTLVATRLFWKGAWAKIEIGIAKGKKTYDKRVALKEKDWQREKLRLMKTNRL
jgi:SsrA-binding protein